MRNIDTLEKRWLRYKIKSFVPHTIIVFVGVILLVVTSFFTQDSSKVQEEKKQEIPKKNQPIQEKISKKAQVIKEVQAIKKPQIQKKEILQEKLLLSPSFDFLDTIERKEKRGKKKPAPIKKEKVKVEKKEKKSIVITRENNYKDIAEVIHRFKKNNNPALSLFVAKKYYELGEYKKSYNYALITNNIDDTIELSWIIFAKSLVKLKQTQKAKKILKEYIANSNSNSAKILLEDIDKGRL